MTFPTWTLQDRITKARTHAGLNQSELAQKMGLSRNTLGRWESGANAPTEKNLQALAEATGVPVEWFYQDDSASTSRPAPGLLPPGSTVTWTSEGLMVSSDDS